MNYRWRGLFFSLSETLNLHYYKQFEYHIWLSYLLLEILKKKKRILMAVIEFCERDDGKEITGLQSQTATHTHFVFFFFFFSFFYLLENQIPKTLTKKKTFLSTFFFFK